jgi:hypothetical protein
LSLGVSTFRTSDWLKISFFKLENNHTVSHTETLDVKIKQASNLSIAHLKKQDHVNPAQNEEKSSINRNEELRALDLNLARAVKQASLTSGLNGNEETALIYGYISHAQTKNVYKELVKFRKRTNFLELCVSFLQKALTEDLAHEVSEWCADTHDWLLKRNTTILGNKSLVTKKAGVVAVSDNQQSVAVNNAELVDDQDVKKDKNAADSLKSQITSMTQQFKRRRIKKYKLLIPLNLDETKRTEMEEQQKEAIDKIFDLFPEMYDKWMRKRRLRRLLNDESPFRSQFAAIWALAEFGIFINRIQQFQTDYALSAKLNDSQYLDPQRFLFDFNNCMIVPDVNRHNANLLKPATDDADESIAVQSSKQHQQQQQKADLKYSVNSDGGVRHPRGTLKQNFKDSKTSAKNTDYKDTSDLLAQVLVGNEKHDEKHRSNSQERINREKSLSKINRNLSANTSENNMKTIVQSLRGIFGKFEKAIVSV